MQEIFDHRPKQRHDVTGQILHCDGELEFTCPRTQHDLQCRLSRGFRGVPQTLHELPDDRDHFFHVEAEVEKSLATQHGFGIGPRLDRRTGIVDLAKRAA